MKCETRIHQNHLKASFKPSLLLGSDVAAANPSQEAVLFQIQVSFWLLGRGKGFSEQWGWKSPL